MENSAIDYESIFKLDPYSLCKEDKESFLTQNIKNLCKFHYKHCNEYKRILDAFNVRIMNLDSYYNAPFLPVRLFKHYTLKSIEKSEIIKTMTSSGTSGQSVSQIFLDKQTSLNQTKALSRIMQSFIGNKRMPMIIIDSSHLLQNRAMFSQIFLDKQTSLNQTKALSRIMQSFIGNKRMPMIIIDSSHLLQNRAMFSARGAGVLGFSMFAREKIYALDKDMNLNVALIRDFIEKHKGKKILLFGFTFIVWQHFYNELKRLNLFLDLKDSILIHGGGWKKLISQAVSKERFKSELESVCSVRKIHNYYGMVEQTGSIYMECECGNLHTPIFADIIVRRARDFSIADMGEEGILELVSLLPHSYPGHIILSEDIGTILGEDNCPCGRKGKYFSINGRIQNAEIRGCSDTYEQK